MPCVTAVNAAMSTSRQPESVLVPSTYAKASTTLIAPSTSGMRLSAMRAYFFSPAPAIYSTGMSTKSSGRMKLLR